MAKSKYEYVKHFEMNDALLPNTWLVVRIDGRSFHKFCQLHKFAKPNDVQALALMNRCAQACMEEFSDIVLAYGESDEYSFVFKKSTTLFGRRASKIVTAVVSCFSGQYVFQWGNYLKNEDGSVRELQYPPQFDGRIVCYPSLKNLRDYLSWRQADCAWCASLTLTMAGHINNLYNTLFWTVVLKGNMSETEAEAKIRGTFSADKNEMLFNYGINYNDEPAMFRKGSVLLRSQFEEEVPVRGPVATADGTEAQAAATSRTAKRIRKTVAVEHCDMIGEQFWIDNKLTFEAD